MLINLRLGLIGLHLLAGVIQAGLLFPLLRFPARRRLKQWWSRQLLLLLGIRIDARTDAFSATTQGLLVCNHISFVDIFIINALLPAGFVAKSEVAGWPLIGWLSARTETIFIARGSRRAAHETQRCMVAAMRTGARLAIFPEGTTTAGRSVLPFHGALFQAAIDADVDVHCLAISYQDRAGRHHPAPAYVGDTSLLQCMRDILAARDIVARVAVVTRFRPPLGDRRHLAHQAHTAIAHGLAELTRATNPEPAPGATPQPIRNPAATPP